MRVLVTSAVLALLLTGAPGAVTGARAQSSTVTAADIQRLQDSVSALSGDVSRLRGRDRPLADRLQGDLDDLRDEVIYLRVKLRKEGSVSRAEYAGTRDKVDDLRGQMRNDAASSSRPPAATAMPSERRSGGLIPVGQELDVRLQDPLNSGRNQVEDRFIATTLVDLQVGERVVIPAGSELRGVVSSVTSAGRLNRKGSLTVSFDELTVSGRTYPMRGTVTQALESEGVRGEAGRIGTGAGVGAIIGGILGGLKGALAGILIGGGGVVVATEGKEVDLPPGTVLRVRLDSPPALR